MAEELAQKLTGLAKADKASLLALCQLIMGQEGNLQSTKDELAKTVVQEVTNMKIEMAQMEAKLEDVSAYIGHRA